MADAIGTPERVDDRIHHRRAGANGTGLAGPFDAERIGAARHVAGLESERRHVVGTRQDTAPMLRTYSGVVRAISREPLR